LLYKTFIKPLLKIEKMETLNFSINIHAPATKVWEILWNDTTYRQWTAPFCEGSHALSEWKEGSNVQFLTPTGEGMYSVIEKLEPNQLMSFKHIGAIKNFEYQPFDDESKRWSGAKEIYSLQESENNTTLTVQVDTDESFAEFFNQAFSKAIDIVRQLAEGILKPSITVSVVVHAPIEKVWQCWALPEHIAQWNNASDDWHTPHATNDLHAGGKLLWRMEARDGSMGVDFEGVYDDVQTNERIVYTIADGRKVNIVFTPEGDGVKVTETFETENTHPHDMQRTGWQAILDNFKKHVEGHS